MKLANGKELNDAMLEGGNQQGVSLTPKPLDLRTVAEEFDDSFVRPAVWRENGRALLAHCRALRLELEGISTAVNSWGDYEFWQKRAAAVLAQVRDE